MYNYAEITEQFPACLSWWEHQTIVSAIPQHWKRQIKIESAEDDSIEVESIYCEFQHRHKIVKEIYRQLNGEKASVMKQNYDKFKRHISLNVESYEQGFTDLMLVTNIVKYRDFQYRLLVGNIYTNDRLFYWNKVPSQKCEYCKQKQMLTHLLFDCDMAKDTWMNLHDFIVKFMEVTENQLNWDLQAIMLNKVHPNSSDIINLLVLITKQYIFSCKCLKKKIYFPHIVQKIENIYQLERYNVQTKNQMCKHQIKWEKYNVKPSDTLD